MINYVFGDATWPLGDDNKIIAHICNNFGAWGSGFVLAVSRRWPGPEQKYRRMRGRASQPSMNLGTIQMVKVDHNLFVCNMIAQHGIGPGKQGRPPIRYDALGECLAKLQVEAQKMSASVHMPRIGCGLAGGRWQEIEPIIERMLIQQGVKVTVYDLPVRVA